MKKKKEAECCDMKVAKNGEGMDSEDKGKTSRGQQAKPNCVWNNDTPPYTC